MNVAVYSPKQGRWAMTERRESSIEQTSASIRVGPSWMSWDGKDLDVWVDEIGCPRPRRIRGRIKLSGGALTSERFVIDKNGRHTWQPLVTSARIEVDLQKPGISWSGSGYLDTNFGSEPLEAAFDRWNWSRSTISSGTVVQYDVATKSGSRRSMTVELDRDGAPHEVELPGSHRLPATRLWRIAREVRSDAQGQALVERTLEDTPFYSRSLVHADVLGERAQMVHESCDLRRFAHPAVQFMLAWRMPRRWV